MDPCVYIGTAQHIDLLKKDLNQQFRVLEDKGLKFKLNEKPMGKYTFFYCNLEEGNQQGEKEKNNKIFKNCLAEILSDFILSEWEEKIVQNIIRENYYYFNEQEKEKIYQHTLNYLNDECGKIDPTTNDLKRKRIYNRLNEYLAHNNKLILEGFINFRLKEYISNLKEAIDSAVDDFLLEKEYGEFVQLLRYFLEMQESQIDLVHVVVKEDGMFELLDKEKKAIANDYSKDIMFNINGEITYEDMLISVLISLAPRKIIFHSNGNKNSLAKLKTLRDIFESRVEDATEYLK